MNLLDALVGEHAILSVQLLELDRVSKRAASLPELQAATNIFAKALSAHAQLEDDLLYGDLTAKLEFAGPIHYEHERIRRMMNSVAEAADVDEAREVLREALKMERKHFVKEETHLFPMALKVLGEKKLETLCAAWARRRKVQLSSSEARS